MAFLDDFLQPDGSIQMEVDFRIQSAKFCKDDGENEQNSNKENGTNGETKNE